MATELADEITRYLHAQIPALVVGTNMFIGRVPDTPEAPNACVGIIETGGTAPLTTQIGQSQADIKVDRPSFQVRVRDPDYTTGYATIQNIYSKLRPIVEQTIVGGGSLIHNLEALQSPTYIGRDEVQRHSFTMNFLAVWENPNR